MTKPNEDLQVLNTETESGEDRQLIALQVLNPEQDSDISITATDSFTGKWSDVTDFVGGYVEQVFISNCKGVSVYAYVAEDYVIEKGENLTIGLNGNNLHGNVLFAGKYNHEFVNLPQAVINNLLQAFTA